MMHVKRLFIIMLLQTVAVGFACADSTPAEEPIDLQALFQQIDDAISLSPTFVAERERKIADYRDSLQQEKSVEGKVRMAEEIFLLYQSYKNDSALHYAEVCISLADSLRRRDLAGRYRSLLARQCSGCDMYNESLEQLRLVNRQALDKTGLCDYYNAWMHVCGELGSYTQRPDVRKYYFGKQNLYRDSVLMVVDEGSEHSLHLKMDILNARQLYQDAMGVSDEWLRHVANGTHEMAYAAFYRSMVYEKLRNDKMVRYWLGISALADIRCAVMNQASLLFLAERLADDGDISRAVRYEEFAKECNLFFSPYLRKYQVNSVINVAEKSNQAAQTRADVVLIVAVCIIILLLVALLYTILRLRRNNKN